MSGSVEHRNAATDDAGGDDAEDEDEEEDEERAMARGATRIQAQWRGRKRAARSCTWAFWRCSGGSGSAGGVFKELADVLGYVLGRFR